MAADFRDMAVTVAADQSDQEVCTMAVRMEELVAILYRRTILV
jgi:hypothetical protein